MERVRPAAVLACLVLLVAGVAPGAVGSAGAPDEGGPPAPPAAAVVPPAPAVNTTARLVLPSYRVTQTEFETVRLEMGGSLQTRAEGVLDEHDRLTVERKFEAAESLDEKRSIVDGTLIGLRDRTRTLEVRERAAIRDYSDGNITAKTLVRELIRIDASAREIGRTLDLLSTLTSRAGINRFSSPISSLALQAKSLQGPVRREAGRTLAGQARSKRVWVTASDTGVILSTLRTDTYVREATDYRNRRPDEGNNVDSSEDRAAELYPWAWNDSGYHQSDGALSYDLYRIILPHSQGRLVAYLDTGSADIYREVQTLRIDDMPTTMTLARTGNGLRVVLERTYVGGPLHVAVEDSATGAAVNAAVTVDGYDLGNTGADGRVRTIEPRPSYTINVTHGDASLSVTVERPLEESEN